MADYRIISQDYAKEAIRASVLINAGAAVALLSQAADLIRQHLADEIRCAMIAWSIGVAVAALAWSAAFMSTRFVDKSEKEPTIRALHIDRSNVWMVIGQALVLLSLGAFVWGCCALASGLVDQPSAAAPAAPTSPAPPG